VTIYDCGLVEATRGPTAFIAMELLSGESLTKRLAHSRRFAPDLAAEIGRQVASALEAAHRVDVLHRDLKPDNIHLVPDPAMPSGERVKILDFGLAKLGAGGHTQVQNVFGTPRYMSPEQCRSCAQVDHRGDIYALGCILFELVTGRPPFEGDVRKVLSAHQNIVPPRVRTIAQDCPPAFDELIAEMLAKDPAARPRNMAAVQQALASTGAIRLATSESRAFPPLRVVPVTRVRKPSTAPPIVAVAAPAEPPPSSEFAAMAIVPFPHPQAEGSAPIAVEPRGDSPPPPAVRATTLGHPTPPGRTTLLDHDGWLRRTLRDYAAGDRHADRPLAELIVLGAIIVLLAVAVAILLA
jgi:serine/threonine-protein kinase